MFKLKRLLMLPTLFVLCTLAKKRKCSLKGVKTAITNVAIIIK